MYAGYTVSSKSHDHHLPAPVAIGFVGQPIGSFLSGWATEPLGRKRSLLYVNVTHIIGWLLMHRAAHKWHMYTATAFFGFGIGLMESPITTYVAEISESTIRGTLLSVGMLNAMLGYLIVYWLGAITDWRTVALACLACPLTAMLAIMFVPETPFWLLVHGRERDARRSLQWLRGWVSSEAVGTELDALRRQHERHERMSGGQTASSCGRRAVAHVRMLCDRPTRRPFVMMCVLFAGIQFGGYSSVRPYMVQMFATLRLPQDPHWATVGFACAGLAGTVLCTAVIRCTGRRRLYLTSTAGVFASLAVITVHAAGLPAGTSSFDKPLPPPNAAPSAMDWTALVAMYALAFNTTAGLYPVTFSLLGEVFPFRSRGIAAGVCFTVNHMLAFLSSKTFQLAEQTLSIGGLFAAYASVVALGFVYAWLYMPETENRTLDEVEMIYAK